MTSFIQCEWNSNLEEQILARFKCKISKGLNTLLFDQYKRLLWTQQIVMNFQQFQNLQQWISDQSRSGGHQTCSLWRNQTFTMPKRCYERGYRQILWFFVAQQSNVLTLTERNQPSFICIRIGHSKPTREKLSTKSRSPPECQFYGYTNKHVTHFTGLS